MPKDCHEITGFLLIFKLKIKVPVTQINVIEVESENVKPSYVASVGTYISY